MRITWNELTVSSDGVDLDGLLSEWRWLADESFQPVVISALGELFLRHDDGRIFWLSAGWGQLTEVAASAEEFKRLMVQPENANEWFVPQLVGDIRSPMPSARSAGGCGPRPFCHRPKPARLSRNSPSQCGNCS